MSFDICVLRDGNWEIYGMDMNEDSAVSSAIDLQANFPAVAVLQEDRMRVVYQFDRGGKNLNYGAIKSGLNAPRKAKPTPVRRSAPPPRPTPTTISKPIYSPAPQKRGFLEEFLYKILAIYYALTNQHPPAHTTTAHPSAAQPASAPSKDGPSTAELAASKRAAQQAAKEDEKARREAQKKVASFTEKDESTLFGPRRQVEKQNANDTSVSEKMHAQKMEQRAFDDASKLGEKNTQEQRAQVQAGPIPSISEEDVSTSPSFNADDLLIRMLGEGKYLRWKAAEGRMAGDVHFGLLLYITGASRIFAMHTGQTRDSAHAFLAKIFMSIGMDHDTTLGFIENVDEFLLFPRYAAMYQAGQRTARTLTTDPESDLGVKSAIEIWESDASTPDAHDAPTFQSVLFTDIVNFTANQQSQGDGWMTDVLKAHNSIVRDTIQSYNGREVKHTGDGIMASFPSAPKALEAAISMQKGFDTFRQKMPKRTFDVRIGISAGEPVEMDGDLFGGPVNMAARLLTMAGANDIVVAPIVRESMPENTIGFRERSQDLDIKGFENITSVYHVLWKGDAQKTEEDDTPSSATS